MSDKWNSRQPVLTPHVRSSQVVVDGELVEESEYRRSVRKDVQRFPFIRVSVYPGLFDALNRKERLVLDFMAGHMGYSNVVSLDKSRRKALEETYGFSSRTVYNAVNRLVGSGFVYKIRRGKYLVNPEVMTRMSTDSVRHVIRYINYDAEGRMELLCDVNELLKQIESK